MQETLYFCTSDVCGTAISAMDCVLGSSQVLQLCIPRTVTGKPGSAMTSDQVLSVCVHAHVGNLYVECYMIMREMQSQHTPLSCGPTAW